MILELQSFEILLFVQTNDVTEETKEHIQEAFADLHIKAVRGLVEVAHLKPEDLNLVRKNAESIFVRFHNFFTGLPYGRCGFVQHFPADLD